MSCFSTPVKDVSQSASTPAANDRESPESIRKLIRTGGWRPYQKFSMSLTTPTTKNSTSKPKGVTHCLRCHQQQHPSEQPSPKRVDEFTLIAASSPHHTSCSLMVATIAPSPAGNVATQTANIKYRRNQQETQSHTTVTHSETPATPTPAQITVSKSHRSSNSNHNHWIFHNQYAVNEYGIFGRCKPLTVRLGVLAHGSYA